MTTTTVDPTYCVAYPRMCEYFGRAMKDSDSRYLLTIIACLPLACKNASDNVEPFAIIDAATEILVERGLAQTPYSAA